MPMEVYDYKQSKWAVSAKAWLEKAISDLMDGHDPIPAVSAGLACLRIDVAELPEDPDLLTVIEP